MRRRMVLVLALVLLSGLTAYSPGRAQEAPGSDPQRITVDQLKKMLGSPDLIVIDVRDPLSWSKSETKIVGAVREDPTQLRQWADRYPKDKTIVLYCS